MWQKRVLFQEMVTIYRKKSFTDLEILKVPYITVSALVTQTLDIEQGMKSKFANDTLSNLKFQVYRYYICAYTANIIKKHRKSEPVNVSRQPNQYEDVCNANVYGIISLNHCNMC